MTTPQDIRKIHDYLNAQRKQVDEKYDYRYSMLPLILARLVQEKWLSQEDLRGLDEEKLRIIKNIIAF